MWPTAQDTLNAMAQGSLSAEGLMGQTLDRVAAVNPAVNAIVSLRPAEDLLAEARAADAARRDGSVGPLHGLPIAIKDLSDAKGLPTSKGSPLFAGAGPVGADSLFVSRIRAAGAIVIGKTNTPEFGLGSHTFNPVFGPTRNPYDLSRTPGGSSGGASVALATGMLALADGSDMMGSLRNPAGWCNVYGMRPTWGLVPQEPEGDTYLHTLSTAGPMARCPRDLALLLSVMAGPDARLPVTVPVPDLADLRPVTKGVRIGWLGDWGGALPMEPGILPLVESALGGFSDLGCAVAPVAAPFEAAALWESWITLRSWSVAMSNGAFLDAPESRALLKPEMVWEIGRGRGLSAAAVHEASVIRSRWFATVARLFEAYDVLVLPSAQVWPFAVETRWPDRIGGALMDTYHRWMEVVVPASLIGLPVVNVPVGFGANGLPMGAQLIGRPGADLALLQLAQGWHEATDWPGARPPSL
jgi:amidase